MNWIKVIPTDRVGKLPMWVTNGYRVELWTVRNAPPITITDITHYMPVEFLPPDLPEREEE